jgi:S1-C subfamily serine protease/antitoxin component YwqK of YwqJK toxin-antitoxin module
MKENRKNTIRINIAIWMLVLPILTFSQSTITKVFYYDTDWNKVESRDNASYSRIISFDTADYNFNHPIGWVKDYYRPSGNLQWKGKFDYYDINNNDNNIPKGIVTWYHDKRDAKRQESYYSYGKKEGETTYWHENGEIESVLVYKNNKLEGTVEIYDDKGNLFSKSEYISGKLDGFYRQYYPNGNTKRISRYENGRLADKYAMEFDEYGDCKLVAKDYFRNNNNNWRVGESNDGNSEYNLDTIKGEYSIISNIDDSYIKWEFTNFGVNQGFNPLSLSFSNYVVESRLKHVNNDDIGSYGIFFGVKDADNYMYFKVFEGKDKIVCRVTSKHDGIFRELSDWEEIKNYKKNEFNTFQIRQSINYDEDNEIESWTLKFIVNGYQAMESKVDILHGFNFGFGVSGAETEVTCNYLNIRYPCPSGNSGGSETTGNECEVGSAGSGFAINKEGYIATNFHVISDKSTGEICDDIEIRGINGDDSKTYTARVVTVDEENDLAILKIEEMIYDIPYSIGNDIDIAESVCAYGYPLMFDMGYALKYSNGVINGKTGKDGDVRVLQHTALIDGGSSGGPLFNLDGEVIGINSSGYTGGNTALFFAVKSTFLLSLINTIDLEFKRYTELEGISQTAQYKQIKNYVYLIEVGLSE